MKQSSQNFLNRRRFLGTCGKMTGIGAMSSLLNLRLTSQAFASQASATPITDYKGLVCIFLFGGNDSFNTLAPGVDGYQSYLDTRGTLGIPLADMHQIFDNGQDYHLSSSLGAANNGDSVQKMFNDGDLSFLANIGTLVEPVASVSDIAGKTLPYGRFSHSDQLEQWQTSISESKTTPLAGTGWTGRLLDCLNDNANSGTLSAALSPYGANISQIGRSTTPFLVNGGVDSLDLYGSDALVTGGMDASLEAQYASVLQAHHNYIRQDALDQSARFEEVEQNVQINTPFPGSSLGQQLLQVAKYIKAQGTASVDGVAGLGMNRQTFFVGQGGFDSHGGGTAVHDSLMQTVNDAVVAFNTALKEIEDEQGNAYHDKVVAYTASDFGRTLTPNAAGSDHGWGGNQMLFGGPVTGGKVFGEYPDIALGTSTDVGRGRQLPKISVDALHASLARWFGVPNGSEMVDILPNIRNFYSESDNGYPIPGLLT